MRKFLSNPKNGCVMSSERFQGGLTLYWQGKGENCPARITDSSGAIKHEGSYATAIQWLRERNLDRRA